MRSMRPTISLMIALALTGCGTFGGGGPPPSTSAVEPPAAPQPSVTAGLDRYLEQRAHVESVGFRLRRAAAGRCAAQKRMKPDIGLIVWSLANFPNAEDRAYLQQKFALNDTVTVALPVAGAPAAAAGLEPGATITQVGDKDVGTGKGATERFIVLSNAAAKDGLVMLRLADSRTVKIKPQLLCDYPTLLVRSPEINAAADGRVLAITTALFDLTQSDDELALVLGHELAHNVLGHLREPTIAKAKPGILDAFMRATIGTAVASSVMPPFSIEHEKEADYVGLYFMARAGYDIRAAESFWRRLSESQNAASVSATHPSAPARLEAIKATIAEINAKRKTKAPLEPNAKPPG